MTTTTLAKAIRKKKPFQVRSKKGDDLLLFGASKHHAVELPYLRSFSGQPIVDQIGGWDMPVRILSKSEGQDIALQQLQDERDAIDTKGLITNFRLKIVNEYFDNLEQGTNRVFSGNNPLTYREFIHTFYSHSNTLALIPNKSLKDITYLQSHEIESILRNLIQMPCKSFGANGVAYSMVTNMDGESCLQRGFTDMKDMSLEDFTKTHFALPVSRNDCAYIAEDRALYK